MCQENFDYIYQNNLNPIQRRVLMLVLAGNNNSAIAESIQINDTSGVSYHVRRIAETFNITDDFRDRLIELFINYRPEDVSPGLRVRYGYGCSPKNYYQVGGTLNNSCPSYVVRSCDSQLFNELLKGVYCLVLGPRQTGKSSLKIRTIAKLKERNIKCVYVDITLLGGNEGQPARSKGFIAEVFYQLGLELEVNSWWDEHQHLTLMQRLDRGISFILENISDKITIFIDEIDSIPNADDFLAFIRACYNKRATNPEYRRLTFCLLGTASPNELMQNRQRTPFNIGIAINLPGFTLEQAEVSLLSGLSNQINPDILQQVLYWTGGQPFLTQKLCQLIIDNAIARQVNVEQIVQQYIIHNWQQQDSPQHLQTISDRLTKNPDREAILHLYHQILTNPHNGLADTNGGDRITSQLILSGLVIVREQNLQVYNPIYRQVFSTQWLGSQR